MKLSIITVNLNNASGLKKTIESVVSQTSRDFEYIIIDGGSTDGSVEVIRLFTSIPSGIYYSCSGNNPCDKDNVKVEFDHSNSLQSLNQPDPLSELFPRLNMSGESRLIRYWISEADFGIYHAMNKGILIANGEYCQFLNSGDVLVSDDVTEKILDKVSDCPILIGNLLKLLPDGNKYRDKGIGHKKPTFMTFYRGTLNHSSAYIKRDLFDKYGLYDETLKIVSDWKWYLIAVGLNNEMIKFIDLDVTYVDMNGISNSNHELEKKERREVLTDLLPARILEDYDEQWANIDQAARINRYKIIRSFFWIIDRILFKVEKLKYNSYL